MPHCRPDRPAARLALAGLLAMLSACAGQQATPSRDAAVRAPGVVDVHLLAFNDFHGALEPPKIAVTAPVPSHPATETVRVPAGGVAYLASAIEQRRRAEPNSVVVAAGDLIGASPLASALFLDEPSIMALNSLHLEYSAIGNHEFDKGRAELLRIQNGGCAKLTPRTPCALDPAFPGARFRFLAANVRTESGDTFLPASAVRSFGAGAKTVKVGFIGLTLREVTTLVDPSGIAGLTVGDEADAANALVPQLKAQGADAIVILIHQGGRTDGGYDDKSCPGLTGDILPILQRLDPAIDVVVSGHTHKSYICDYGRIDPARPFLLTSAGLYGTLFTDITLSIDPRTRRVVARQADNVIVQGEPYESASGIVPLTDLYPRFPADPPLRAMVSRYAAAAAPRAGRPVGRLAGPAGRTVNVAQESVLGDIVADSYLAATRATGKGGAQLAFSNPGGMRTDLVPAADGSVSYGQLFALQPFGNTLTVTTLTGRQLLDLLEQQFSGTHSPTSPYVLNPSGNVRYAFDLSRPQGSRILDMTIDGRPLNPAGRYRVATNNFLAAGGDGFSLFTQGTDSRGGTLDLDAMEAWLAGRTAPLPETNRIGNRTPGIR